MFSGALIQEPWLLVACSGLQENVLQNSLQREACLLCIHPAHTTRSGESRSTNWAKSLSYSLRASCSSTPGFLYLTRLSRYLSVLRYSIGGKLGSRYAVSIPAFRARSRPSGICQRRYNCQIKRTSFCTI